MQAAGDRRHLAEVPWAIGILETPALHHGVERRGGLIDADAGLQAADELRGGRVRMVEAGSSVRLNGR